MSSYNPELLNQNFINWQDVSKDKNFTDQPNSAKAQAWQNWSSYAKDYWNNQLQNAPEEDKPEYQDVLGKLDGFLKTESEAVAKHFTLAGKLSQIDDTNTVLEYLKTPDQSNKDGFTSEEYASARRRAEDYLLPQLRSFYETSGDTAPSDDVLRKRIWEEPDFSDHFRELQNNLAKGFATVLLGTLQGMGSFGDLMTDPGTKEEQEKLAPEDRDSAGKKLADWARDESKMFQENLPSDPRMNKWTEVAYSAVGQLPAQALTAWNTPLNLTANLTQTYSQETDNIFEEQKKSLFDTQRAAGTIPKETPFKAWEKTLSKEQIDNLRASAGLKAIPSTTINAALETLAEKVALKGVPWSSIPGGKIVQDKINKLMKTKPATAVGARIFAEGVAALTEESVAEGGQGIVSNVAQAVAGRGELPSFKEAGNQLGENMLGGAVGGAGLSLMSSPVSAFRQQAIFDDSNKILDGSAPSIQGLKAQYEKAVNEYGESSPQADAVQKAITDVEDSAHFALRQLGSPEADKARAARYEAASAARNTFRDQLLRWVGDNQNGVERIEQIEIDRASKVEQVKKTWAGIRQSFQKNGLNIDEAAIQSGEAAAIDAVNKDAEERSKKAEEALMEFVGTADKHGPGRAAYARAVVAKMFPEFTFSPDFKNDAVVTEVLDAVEQGLINNKTDLEEWLSSPAPSKTQAQSQTQTSTPSTDEKQTQGETPVQTTQVSSTDAEGEGVGTGVSGGGQSQDSRTSAILVEDPDTKEVFTQTRDDYRFEAEEIGKLVADPSKPVSKKDANRILQGIENAENEINGADELTDEQKKDWFSPFESVRAQLQAVLNNKTSEDSQTEGDSTPPVEESTPSLSPLEQAISSETPLKLDGQRGVLIRDDAGRPVFKPFDGGPEVELKLNEASQSKEAEQLEPSDYGTDTSTVELADTPSKQFSVLPDNSPRPQRPFFRSEPSKPRSEGKTAPEPKVDTAKIVADVQANPQANTRKEGSKKLVSREGAVAVMVQLPETITRRESIAIGKESGFSKPTEKILRLAELRNDPNAARDILAGKYDAELGLFDRSAVAQSEGNEQAGSSPTEDSKQPASDVTVTPAASPTVEAEPEVRSSKKAPPPAVTPEQTVADRWINDSLSALQAMAAGSPAGAAFAQRLETPEGRDEVRKGLAGMYYSMLKSLKAKGISDPVVIDEAMERIFRGSVTQSGGGNLTKSVLGDLSNNIKETGDPFKVQRADGTTAAYSAWLARGRNQVQSIYRQQNSREQALPDSEGDTKGTNIEDSKASSTSTLDTKTENELEVERMKNLAVNAAYQRVIADAAKELGLPINDAGLAFLNLLNAKTGLEIDPISLGWKKEGDTSRIKQTVKRALEPIFPSVLQKLQTEMRTAINDVMNTAEENGLLVAPVTKPTLESLIESSLYAERLQQKFQEPLKQARESKSPEPLIPLLNQIYSDPATRGLLNQAVASYVNSGAPLKNIEAHHRLIGGLTKEDVQQILNSGLLPDGVREVLQTLSDLSGSSGLDLVKASSNEGWRRLAELLDTQIGKLANPVQVVFNLALDPQVTGGGLWVGGSNVHVSPFLTAPGQMEATILHEVMHPVWDWKITTFLQNPESPLLNDSERAALTEIKELHDRIREEAQRRVDEAKAAGKDTKVLERDLRGALGDGDATLALREFLNEALSHKAFQNFLNEMKVEGDGKTSVFRRVLNMILRAITGNNVALDSVLQRSFELSLEVAKGPVEEATQAPSRESYLQGIEQRLGRALSPEEITVYSADYAARYPQSPLSDTRAEADSKASVLLSGPELDSYNYLKQTEGEPITLPRAEALDTEKLAQAIKSQGGLTLNVWDGKAQNAGFVVAPYKETETKIPVNNFTASSVKDFLRKFQPLLEVPGMHFGAWIPDNEPDTVYLDVSIVTDDELYATTIAQDGNQLAIFNLGAFQELATPDLLTKYSGEVEQHRASDGYQDFAASLKQAGDRVFRGVREQGDRVSSQERATEGRADGELAGAQYPELGVAQSLTGGKLTPDEINEIQGPLQSAPSGQLDDGSGAISFIYGRAGLNRQSSLRSAEGLRILSEAIARHVGGDEGARKTNESLTRGFRLLEKLVREAELNIAPPFFKRLANPRTQIAESGAEHSVYGDPSTQRVIKLTHADDIGDGALGAKGGADDYFLSLLLNNLVFNTGTRFEGLVNLGAPLPQVVTSQPWLKGRKATIPEIRADLLKRGFTSRDARKDANVWEHKGLGIGIYDAVPSNVMRNKDGELSYFDVDVFPILPLKEVMSRIEGGQKMLQSAPAQSEANEKQASIGAFADKLAAMSEEDRENTEQYGFPNNMGWSLFEGRKLISTLKPNEPKFKKVTSRNTWVLSENADYVANVGGQPYALFKHEDPDDEEKTVWAFERLGDPLASRTETTWGDGDEDEVVKEMLSDLVGYALQSAPVSVKLDRETASKIANNLVEAGIRSPGTLRITAETFNVPLSAVQSVKKYLLGETKLYGSLEKHAEFIEKGWDDEKVGVGKVFTGVVPTDVADGERIWEELKKNQAMQSAPAEVGVSRRAGFATDADNYKVISNLMKGDAERFAVEAGFNNKVSPWFKSRGEAENWANAKVEAMPFQNSRDVVDYVEKKFGKTLKALKTEASANYAGHDAVYVVSGKNGGHFIEYNPMALKGFTKAQVDATMREEMIHAASGLALMDRGEDWVSFYTGLAKSLSKEQRGSLKKVYTSTGNEDMRIGAEYFRASVQKLLYGTITEQEMGTTAMQKIVSLFKDLLSYFQNKLTDPAVREVYNDTIRIMQKADPKYAADVAPGVLQSAPEALSKDQRKAAVEFFRNSEVPVSNVLDLLAKMGNGDSNSITEKLPTGRLFDLARQATGIVATNRLNALSQVRRAVNRVRDTLATEQALQSAPAEVPSNFERIEGDARLPLTDQIWDDLTVAYAEIGGHTFANKEQLISKAPYWDVQRDSNGKPVSYFVSKPGKFGVKLSALASDGSTEGRGLTRSGITTFMTTPGHWGELSEGPERIAQKAGLKPLSVQEVQELLGPDKPITPLEDGYHYTRVITTTDGLNKTVTKAVYGLPLWKTQQTNQPDQITQMLTGKTTLSIGSASSQTAPSESSLPRNSQNSNLPSSELTLRTPGASRSASLSSAPVFQGAPVPGFTPSVFTPASRRQTEALLRVRSNPEYAAIQSVLGNKTYYSWTEKDTLAKADEFIAAFNGDLPLAFQSSLTNPGLTNEQAIMVRGLSIKRAQAAANAAGAGMTDTSLSAQRRNDMAMARDYYQSLAETFADSVMNEASQAGQELRTFRMLADVLVPQTWVKKYKAPVIRAQRNKLGKEKTAQQLLQGLMDSRRMAANSTFDRMQKALAMAGRKFLPEGTSSEEVEAYEDVARMLASGLPVREDVKKAASERVVISGLETIKKELNLRAEKADPALLRQWEDRLREIAGEQIDRIIENRLKGGKVDPLTETLTEDQKQAVQEQKIMDVWRSLSDVPLAETVFNLARATMETAKNPYSGLLRNAVFDTNRVSQIEKAVRLSISTAEEIRKSVADKEMSVEALKLRLEEVNPTLSDEELDKLANAVEAVYNDEVSKASRAALDRLVKAAANPAKARQLTENNTVMKLLPLVNMGAFSEEAVYNAIADKFKLPTWTSENVRAIEEAANRVQELPEGSIQRGEAGQQMLLEILKANMKDSRGGKRVQHLNQIASAVWTAGVLSGPPTQIINATATSASVFMESMAEATGRFIEAKQRGVSTAQASEYFKDIARMWLFSFGKDANNTSLRAMNEVYTAMTKGTTKFKSEKMEDMAPLELFKFDPRAAIPGNAMMDALVNGEWKEAGKQGLKAGLGLAIAGLDKAVVQRNPKEALKDYLAVLRTTGRLMLAADAVNSSAAAYIKEAMIKRTLLQQEGLSDDEVNKMMSEIVKGGEQSLLDDAKAQVEDESIRGDFGAPGTTAHEVAKARRLEQLIETATYGKSVVEAGRDFAADSTFNGNPYGVVGMLSMEIFARMNSALGIAVKPVNPFPKTLSNLFNNALNYTLWGSLRAQGWNPSQFLFDENSKYMKEAPERGTAEYYSAHARAVAGTTALVAFAAMLMLSLRDRKEGKEPFFELHGPGPTDPKQRKTWSNAGNKAFSVRIGQVNLRFTDWPGINLALGALGTVYDQAIYGSGEADVADKLFTAVTSVMGTTLNRNMLGGASALFDIMSQNTYEGAKQRAAATFASSYVSGFTKPSMVRWLETNISGGYADSSGMSGWLLSMVPFGGAVAGKPALNVLGEKVEVSHWDSTMGRLISPKSSHPILSPLINAGLSVPLPQHYKILDSSKETGMRKMTADEFYQYGKAYGETLKELLTSDRVENLVERASRDPQKAQDRLNELATRARNKAQREVRNELEIKKAPRRVPQSMRATP